MIIGKIDRTEINAHLLEAERIESKLTKIQNTYKNNIITYMQNVAFAYNNLKAAYDQLNLRYTLLKNMKEELAKRG